MRNQISALPPAVRARAEREIAGIEIALQPIIEIATGRVRAVEALARFGSVPDRPADAVIAEAHADGYGYLIEEACLRAALERRGELPGDVRMAINVTPDVLHHPGMARAWDGDLDGVIVEVTEHAASDPVALAEQLTRLRRRGADIAVDDVGTGYAGLLRLATMRPDIVKIDRTVVAGVRASAAQSAVLEALVAFSRRMEAVVIGEGVESLDDLVALAEFDVDYGQGWAVGRPAPTLRPIAAEVVATCQHARVGVLQRRGALGASAAAAQGMHAVTSALTEAADVGELHAATVRAAAEIDVDVISISVLDTDGRLHEIASSEAVEAGTYAVADYPATRTVLQTGATVEIHLRDPDADAAERALLRELGHESLLMIPLSVGGAPVGVLELAHRTHRRWTTHDIAHARGLATHLGHALLRIRG